MRAIDSAAPACNPALAARLAEIDRLLVQTYGEPEWRPHHDPLSELIAVVLSQNTSDVNSGRAFESLRRRFPAWEAVRDADEADIATAIRAGGLATLKAPRIKAILQELTRRFGTLDLDFICSRPREEVEALLRALPGIGAKSVACVLLFACGRPAMPVDTHVHRVCRRLGITNERTTPEQAQRILEAHVPPDRIYPLHINLIRHGRQLCKAPRPLCERCPLQPVCYYYQTIRRPPDAAAATQEASA